jgi:hypothetical protein
MTLTENSETPFLRVEKAPLKNPFKILLAIIP